MRRLSVKQRLTLWIAALTLVMVGLVLGMMVPFSGAVVTEYTCRQLETTLRAKLPSISREEERLVFQEGFSFVENGVYTILYSDSGALLAGQLPLAFPDEVPFENGHLRDEGSYYVMDFHLPFNWEDGVWVRGVTPIPNTGELVQRLGQTALVLMPLMAAVSALGAYLLARSTFRPIERIIQGAEAIGGGGDLSLRIGLPEGRDEISRLGQAFDRMFERLEAAFEAEKQFTSDASHELRTPIAVILAQCEEARSHAETVEQYAEAMEVVERQGRRMSALVGQLLQMTRLELGTQPIHLEQADLSSLVEVICAEQPPSPQRIALQTDVEPEVEAWFDVTLMSRLLQNLLGNAFRYGKEGGHIWVTLRKNGEEVTLAVRDDGVGIPAEKLEKIWQRFYQVDGARSTEGSAGLGLTIVEQIARLHGGKITADSIQGAGSCFTLRFPATPSQQLQD